jgi:hypothetical protein
MTMAMIPTTLIQGTLNRSLRRGADGCVACVIAASKQETKW